MLLEEVSRRVTEEYYEEQRRTQGGRESTGGEGEGEDGHEEET